MSAYHNDLNGSAIFRHTYDLAHKCSAHAPPQVLMSNSEVVDIAGEPTRIVHWRRKPKPGDNEAIDATVRLVDKRDDLITPK